MTRRRSSIFAVLAAVLALAVAPFATGAAAAADGDDSPVTTPDNIRVDVGVSSVTVDWDPSTPDADVLGYYVKVGNYLRYEWTEEPTATFYLAKSRTYTVTVRAVAADYTRSSEWSEPVTSTTPDEFPVTTPSSIQGTSSQGVVTVSWDRSASDAGMMDYVAILHGGASGPIGSRTLDPTTTTTFTYPPGGDLWVTVQARDKAYRYSDTCDPVPVTVEPADNWEPPSTPANFRATPTDSGVLFQWDEPAHGIGPFTYEIYLDGSEVEEVRGDLELDSEYFFECNTRPRLTPTEFTITAKSYGFTAQRGHHLVLLGRSTGDERGVD